MTGMVVNVTVVPAQTGLAEAAIETLTAGDGLTDMVMVLELAGLPDLQVRDEVIFT